MAGEERPVFGYIQQEKDAKLEIGAEKMFAPISVAFKAAEDLIKEEAAAAEQKKIDDEAAANAVGENTDGNTTDDGATQFTAHATAVLAAVYALAF